MQTSYDVLSPNCPSRVVLNRIGDRWTIFVIMALNGQVLRFGELRERIGAITPKVLTETLRALEGDGLVAREAFAEMPPRVEYRLTALGVSLLEPIGAVRRWAETHVSEVLDARERSAEVGA
ncbi:transcriptional regulator [Nakamurella silvestris]|nr:transcriptional regulator [Nakamurella silvestris]